MRKFVLLLAIAALLALPGLTFAQPLQSNLSLDIVYNAATVAPLTGGVVQFDPSIHSSIIFDLVITNPTPTAITGFQYFINANPVAEEAQWKWAAFTNGAPFTLAQWVSGVQANGGVGVAMNLFGAPEAVHVGGGAL